MQVVAVVGKSFFPQFIELSILDYGVTLRDVTFLLNIVTHWNHKTTTQTTVEINQKSCYTNWKERAGSPETAGLTIWRIHPPLCDYLRFRLSFSKASWRLRFL